MVVRFTQNTDTLIYKYHVLTTYTMEMPPKLMVTSILTKSIVKMVGAEYLTIYEPLCEIHSLQPFLPKSDSSVMISAMASS